MDSLWFTLIGALGGVLVTGAATITASLLTQRSQRRISGRALNHEAQNKRRDQRRACFVAFLDAVESPSTDAARSELRHAYNELRITVEEEGTLAEASSLVRAMDDDDRDTIEATTNRLIEAMRNELQLPPL
jgi:hypothetical protein